MWLLRCKSSAKKESPAKTPVKRSSKRTKAMKSPLPSKGSPSAALPIKKAKRGPHEKEEGGNIPVPPPYGARDKPASLPSAAVKNACKKGGKSAKAKKEEVVVEEEEEEEEATAILCDGCDAEHFLMRWGYQKSQRGTGSAPSARPRRPRPPPRSLAPKRRPPQEQHPHPPPVETRARNKKTR